MLPIKSSINTAGTVIFIGSRIVKKETDIKPEPKPMVALTKNANRTINIPAITSNIGIDIKFIQINSICLNFSNNS